MNEEVPVAPSSTTEEFGLLDLLVTLAENIKLLIIGPLVIGLCALGISFLVTPTYQSVAVLQAEQPTASLMATAAVLDPIIATFGLAKDDTVDAARIKLREQIKTAVGRNDKLLTLTVSARTTKQAQEIASALIHQTYLESRPKVLYEPDLKHNWRKPRRDSKMPKMPLVHRSPVWKQMALVQAPNLRVAMPNS